MSALDHQVDGNHYKTMAIQPAEYNTKNEIGFLEGNVIKYVSRWKKKNGVTDLRKAIHNLELLIEMQPETDFEKFRENTSSKVKKPIDLTCALLKISVNDANTIFIAKLFEVYQSKSGELNCDLFNMTYAQIHEMFQEAEAQHKKITGNQKANTNA
ncbi:hypothetical protein TDB9533_01254 [Thalassocella blandensis]|nr:hypothetical protein TDB9533_01254 [Thalassocella blandensis]